MQEITTLLCFPGFRRCPEHSASRWARLAPKGRRRSCTATLLSFSRARRVKTSTAIHDVQGSGITSPLVGQVVEIEGIVVGSFQGATAPEGFYVQEPDATWDSSPSTSEGIYVFDSGNAPPAVGSRIRVKGTVSEFGATGFTMTELGSPTKQVCSTGNFFTRTTITLPVATAGDLERYEGMAVQFTQQLVVVANFNLGAFDELGLAPQVLFVPTQDPNQATWPTNTDLIARSIVYLNDASGVTNTNLFPTLFPPGGLAPSTRYASARASTTIRRARP